MWCNLHPSAHLGEILAREIGQAVESLRTCVTPIFCVNKRGEPQLLGSAVLIEMDGSIFLCTANHVIAENAKSTLYIDGLSKLEALEGTFSVSTEHDVAVLKLTSAQIKALGKYSPLRSDKIASRIQALACKYVEFVGFPETKNRTVFQQHKIKGLIYSVGCSVIGITPTKVRVRFNRKRNIDRKTRKRVKAPEPHGMSGGAMFGATINAETVSGKANPKLIGISTDWLGASNEIFGTGIEIVLAILRDGHQISLPGRLNPLARGR